MRYYKGEIGLVMGTTGGPGDGSAHTIRRKLEFLSQNDTDAVMDIKFYLAKILLDHTDMADDGTVYKAVSVEGRFDSSAPEIQKNGILAKGGETVISMNWNGKKEERELADINYIAEDWLSISLKKSVAKTAPLTEGPGR